MNTVLSTLLAAGSFSKSAEVVLLDTFQGGAVTNRIVNTGTPDPRRHLVICMASFSANGLPNTTTPTIDGSTEGITEVVDYVNNASSDGQAVALYTIKRGSGTSITLTTFDGGLWKVYAVYGASSLTAASNTDHSFTTSFDEVTGLTTVTNSTTTPANGLAFMLYVNNFGTTISNIVGPDAGLTTTTSETMIGCDSKTESRTTYSLTAGSPIICSVVSFTYD